MTSRRLLIASSFLVTAVVTGVVLTRPAPPSSTAPAAAARAHAARSSLSLTLAPGRLVEHHVVLSQDVTVHAFGARGGEMQGQTSLDVVVRMVGIESTPGGTRAALSFVRVDAADVTFQDQDLVDTAARNALLAPVASITLGADGRVRALAAPTGAHPMFTRLLQLVLAETQLTLDAGAAWDASERSGAGTMRAHYVRTDEKDGVALVRTAAVEALTLPGVDTKAGTSLTGQRSIRIARGTVLAQQGEEHLIGKDSAGNDRFVQHTHVEVTLLHEGAAPLPTLVALAPIDPYVVERDDAAAAESALRQRIEGLTQEAMLSVVTAALGTGAVPDHDRFMWRASGLLQAEPASVAALSPLFFDARTRHEGRALILDLLVSARHGSAQAVLTSLLDASVVDDDPRSGLLRQRLSFVRHPTAETLAFVRTRASSSENAWRDPARMSLGSMAGALSRTQRGPEAIAAAELLVSLHAQAADAGERDTIVRALGNAGLDGYDGIILESARAADRNARASAASALRKMRSARSADALLALARDDEAAVSRRALDSLAERPYSTTIGSGVRSALAAREIPDASYQAVVSLLAQHARTDADARAALELILTHDVQDKEVKGRVRQVLSIR